MQKLRKYRLHVFYLIFGTIIALSLLITLSVSASFLSDQLKFPRVRAAQENVADRCTALFANKNLKLGEAPVYIRVFKYERILELWAKDASQNRYVKVKDFSVCAASGQLGPKRQQGDLQVPEGFYHINAFNPNSKYHLSMQINYPNASDKILTTNAANPGNHIMLHGDCGSLGCVAIQDDPIEELYWIVAQARSGGQSSTPVNIFPCKMNTLRYKIKTYLERDNTPLLAFWSNLKEGFDFFEENKQLPRVSVKSDGTYSFR